MAKKADGKLKTRSGEKGCKALTDQILRFHSLCLGGRISMTEQENAPVNAPETSEVAVQPEKNADKKRRPRQIGCPMNYSTATVQLPMVRESSNEAVRTPEDAARVCADIQGLAQESFHVLTLNARNRLLNRHMVSLGLVDSTLVHPREVFRAAVMDGASAIIAVHNHPSSDPTPSAEDLGVTRQLIEAGRILGIPLLDHVIIGRSAEPGKSHISLRESGMCIFTK
jgi:DNA repair protein RadC